MRKFIVALLLSLSLAGCSTSPADTVETSAAVQTDDAVDRSSLDAFDIVSISDSTCLDLAGYNYLHQMLYIRFLDSQAEYIYFDVPDSVYEDLVNADSVGSYYNSSIKGQYECEKLE